MNTVLNPVDTAKELFVSLIDLIFPPLCPLCEIGVEKKGFCTPCSKTFQPIKPPQCTICGVPFLTENDSDHICGECIKKRPPFDRAASLYHYRGGLSEAIRAFKYKKKGSLAATLGDLLAAHPITRENYDIIIPVPLHITRLRERGFNQAMLIAKHLAGRLSLQVDPFILERVRPTPPQASMKRKERIKSIRGAFALKKGNKIKEKNILLIDDVYTTGATVMECSRVLKKGGAAKINVLTLARVIT